MAKTIFTYPTYTNLDPVRVVSQLKSMITAHRQQMEKLCADKQVTTWNAFMEVLTELDVEVSNLISPLSTLNSVLQSDEVRSAHEEVEQILTEYGTWVAHNQDIYQKCLQVAKDPTTTNNPERLAAINHNIRDFKLAGVALPPGKKERFAKLSLELSAQTTKFSNQLLDATGAWTHHITDLKELAGVPEIALASLAGAAKAKDMDGYLLTLDAPCYSVIAQYAENRDLREKIFRAYASRASEIGPHAGQYDNGPIVAKILNIRAELSEIMGYDDYIAWALEPRMANSEAEIMQLVTELRESSHSQARQEYQEFEKFTHEQGIDDLQPWDASYYSQKLKLEKYSYTDEEVRPYFPLDKVLKTLFKILKSLYNIELVADKNINVWHADVQYFSVERDGKPIAGLYLDLLARQHKRGGAWMCDITGRRRDREDNLHLPLAQVVGNFLPPEEGQPVLLTHDDVVTIYHEFGHAIHHTLTEIEVADVAGLGGVPWDAVELPSQMLENWAWDSSILQEMSEHYQTGASLPDDLVQKIIDARNFQSALAMLRQLLFTHFDLAAHSQERGDKTALTIFQELIPDYSFGPRFADNRFPNGFGHVFAGGYAAGYYSYKWAEVLAADAFSLFEERGLFDQETGQLFLDEFLAQGGVREPLANFIAFRGRAPTKDALLRLCGINVANS